MGVAIENSQLSCLVYVSSVNVTDTILWQGHHVYDCICYVYMSNYKYLRFVNRHIEFFIFLLNIENCSIQLLDLKNMG